MKVKNLFNNEVINTVLYYGKILYKSKKSYYFAYFILIILNGSLPIINVLFSKILIQNLIQKTLDGFLLFTGLLVFLNLLATIIKNRCLTFINTVYNFLQTEFEINIADKITRFQYGVIETAEFHEKHENAKVGISWYSGGIAGVANNINIFISNLITIIGTIAIVASFSWMIVIIILSTSVLSVFVTAISQKRDANFRKRLVSVNRKLAYFLNIFRAFQKKLDFTMLLI